MLDSLSKMPDIIILSETWLTNSSVCLCRIEGYIGFHTIRQLGRSGGVSVFVRGCYEAVQVDVANISDETSESCGVRLKLNNNHVYVIGVYRQQSDSVINFNEKFDLLLHMPIFYNQKVIVGGDLNINLLDENDNNTQEFMTNMHMLNFLPVITKPTRFSNTEQSIGPTLLDHIWINSLVDYCSGIISFDLTDHCPTFVIFDNFFTCKTDDSRKKVKVTFRLLKPLYLNDFICRLQQYHWQFGNYNDINTQTKYFIDTLDLMYCRSFPMKTKFVSVKRIKKPWLTPAILRSVKTKSSYFKLLKLGLISRETNNAYRNCLNSVVRSAKRNYFKECFSRCRGDIRGTWRQIKDILVQSDTPSGKYVKKLIIDGNEISSDVDVANAFNDYYSNIARNLDSEIPLSNDCPLSFLNGNFLHSVFLTPVTRDECRCLIAKLKNGGNDKNSLPVFILKQISKFIVDPLTYLINQSFQTGVFPDVLKLARITPIFKSGVPTDVSNYRPISVLPTLSKIFEKCLTNRLYSFVEKNNILSCVQFGFRRSRSTVDAVIELTEHIYNSLNSKEHAVSVFIDFKKAFDTVNHTILFNKLNFYGIRGLPLLLVKSYLTNRVHCVRNVTSVSSVRTSNIGLPQGSIMAPLLFLIYINDLPNVSTTLSSLLFADDTTFLASSSDYNTLIATLNREMTLVLRWTICNRLSLNTQKTFSVLFTNRSHATNPAIDIVINEEAIPLVASSKFLGVIIDCNLRFDKHLSNNESKLSKSIGILYKLKRFAPEDVMLSLYYSLVYPYLTYCNVVWGGSSDVYLGRLFRIQKRIVRIIAGSDYLAHTSPLFYRLGILKLNDIYIYLNAIFMFKRRESMTTAEHTYNTRGRTNAVPTFQRLSLSQRSVSYAGPVVWNGIPNEIKVISSLPPFKVALKNYLLSRYT